MRLSYHQWVFVCVCVCELSQNQPTFIADYGYFASFGSTEFCSVKRCCHLVPLRSGDTEGR